MRNQGISMNDLDFPQFLGLLLAILAAAKLLGAAAQWIGQPAVLGELCAGVLLGGSVSGIVNPNTEVLHLLSELGVIILLFAIGLETDLKKLLKVGAASSVVALVGVMLPFALGYAVCLIFGVSEVTAVTAGAALTATSVGITARVLSDLNRLQEPESQIVLGAAVIDDVIGLVILAVVAGVARGEGVSAWGIAKTTLIAFGFLIATLLIGRLIVPPLVKRFRQIDLPGTPTILALLLAFGLAWLASYAGSATIIGAFAAGLLIRGNPDAHEIEQGIAALGHFFVPLFFVVVGASVDLTVFNPLHSANHPTLVIGGALILAAVLGKFLAGYAPFWISGNKRVIGVGMIPRGEVGLIFAQMGLTTGAFDAAMFSAVTLMVMVTTFMAPPLLRLWFPPAPGARSEKEPEAIEELVMEP
jgi:Kef-type K+ transport system membrane component KefB